MISTTYPEVGCFGVGSGIFMRALNKIFSFNLRPSSSDTINTKFYYSSRNTSVKFEILAGPQFGIESIDFDPKKKTVIIVHGFMSHGGADWVTNMTQAYLQWEDVNVFAVDWSGGSNTFKYWRAVANTRTVGTDIANFMNQLMNATGLNIKNCHFIGHSLGAQIVSFASHELGKVGRITGLDPALPCFNTTSLKDRLDPSDADFVDVIHTNGKQTLIAFGFPYPIGHIDFYPNGGIRQPGCFTSGIPFYKIVDQAICSHGRAYLLFTESMTNRQCRFRGSRWDLTVAGVKSSVEAACDANKETCPEMGIRASKSVDGAYLVITKDAEPYCATESDRLSLSPELLENITNYLQNLTETITPKPESTLSSFIRITKSLIFKNTTSTTARPETTSSSWFGDFVKKVFG
ncbi:pancreatic triacylglycerol lipase-like isoform X2 [Anticarsia gemmatalis]